MAESGLQTRMGRVLAGLELWLEAERDQLPLWLPLVLGTGIVAWFVLPLRELWTGFILASLALAVAGPMFGLPRRIGWASMLAGLALALGCGLVWARAEMKAHPVLTRPVVAIVTGTIERAEDRTAEGRVRLTVVSEDAKVARLRVSIRTEKRNPALAKGARVKLRARLAPPPGPALPGGYDFSRAAWFMELGAVGQVLGEVEVIAPAPQGWGLRDRLTAHVRGTIDGSAGGIAAAFASGDRGGIAPEDEEAMRASGLTHLLSVSGLHITAVVGAAMFVMLRLLALSPTLALRWPLPAIAAGFGALAGIGYTLLTGAEVPTIRSCVAALLVLLGLALGREALTLRLVATGALIILLLWPESIVGASFQMSFAAITSIVAFLEWDRAKRFLARREESIVRRGLRAVAGLLVTGIVVEVALAPIVLFHFHKSGLYGALANLVAIPLTTFVIMPFEALALLLDSIGAGGPFWWVTGKAIAVLIDLAHWVAAFPGAVARLPSFPDAALGLFLVGALWLMLWRTPARLAGLLPIVAGLAWAASGEAADVLVTDDGRHLAVRGDDGRMALLRDRAGEFVRGVFAERAGEDSVEALIADRRYADCTLDLCVITLRREGRSWLIAATRSRHFVPWSELVPLCGEVDLIVSERRLPPKCQPRWLKVDRSMLARTGALAVTLGERPEVLTSRLERDDHPWARAGLRAFAHPTKTDR